ncbi:MAG TPA: phosphoribosyltransferase family protein [Bacteroidia bacterium]|jgi:pyrimidine operon attenuation protein/uracil phosphoribosyltransferase|nr:phosphoribosyltransferase family protein [Bacteroidia bacterium]
METSILNADQIAKKVTRIAYEIYEENASEKEVVLAGTVPGGYELAQKLETVLKKISPLKITLMKVQVDKSKLTQENAVKLDDKINLAGKTVILVDDVLNTGQMLSYCMKTILQYPVKCLRIAVLVDRNHTIFPIKSDYKGLSIATTLQEHIQVNLKTEGKESVILKD